MSNSALADMCQFATRCNQLGCAKLLNEVEGGSDWRLEQDTLDIPTLKVFHF